MEEVTIDKVQTFVNGVPSELTYNIKLREDNHFIQIMSLSESGFCSLLLAVNKIIDKK